MRAVNSRNKFFLFSSKILRMGIQKTPYHKTYELQTGVQDVTVDFQGANRQFDWIEISLVYNKSDKHLSLYDSYNVECAAKMIKLPILPILASSIARQIR